MAFYYVLQHTKKDSTLQINQLWLIEIILNRARTMLTGLGEVLREIRRNDFELLLHMADKLKVSSAFLSAVEHGKKKPPSDLLEKICSNYVLSKPTIRKLSQEIDRATNGIVIKSTKPLARETAAVFARKADTVSEESLLKIKKLLEDGGKG